MDTYNMQDAKSVLEYLHVHFGSAVFQTRGLTISYFKDLAPRLTKELNMLRFLDETGTLSDLSEISPEDALAQKRALEAAKNKLIATKPVDVYYTVDFLQILSEAFHWKYQTYRLDFLKKESVASHTDGKEKQKTVQHSEKKIPAQTRPEPSAPPVKKQTPPVKSRNHGPVIFGLIILAAAVGGTWLLLHKPGTSTTAAINVESTALIRADSEAASSVSSAETENKTETETTVLIRVPDVVGATVPAAKEKLEQAGLRTAASMSGNETAIVTAQDPESGTEVAADTVVSLTYEHIASASAESASSTVSDGASDNIAVKEQTAVSSKSMPTQTSAAADTVVSTPITPEQTVSEPASSSAVQKISASISRATREIIQFTSSGGTAELKVEFAYPSGEKTQMFSLGTFSDGTHEFSPGITIMDPQGTYWIGIYDAAGTLLDSATFVN